MKMARMVGIGLAAGLLVMAGVAGCVRLVPADPVALHVDPGSVTKPATPNNWLVAEGGDAPPLRLAADPATTAARLAEVAAATPRTQVLAGAGGFVTYQTRSAVFGFPDYTTVRIVADGTGSLVTAFARARFGQTDLGVNRARVEGWLAVMSAGS